MIEMFGSAASSSDATDAERQPLVQRPSTPLIEQVLFLLTARQLWQLLIALFFINLVNKDQFQEWLNLLVLTIIADGVLVIGFMICVLLAFSIVWGFRCESFCLAINNVCWLAVATTGAWYCMLAICQLHELEVTCWNKSMCSEEQLDLHGFRNFWLSWGWCPFGLWRCVAGVFWRPWWFVGFVIPQAIFGQGPMAAGLPWWQVREVVIGSVWWPSFFFLLAMGRAIEEDSRMMFVFSLVGSLTLTAIPFYFTAEPIVMFWTFLANSWYLVIVPKAKRSRSARPEESLAVVVMLWQCARVLYVCASLRLEEWNAHKRVEEGLRYALDHPFRAELEQEFAHDPEAGLGVSASPSNGGGLIRQLSRLAGVGALGREAASSLREKHHTLAEACREWRGSAATLPSRLALQVRRSSLLEDTWQALSSKPVSELLAPHMTVRFQEEMGSDAGGLTRDWFDSVARGLAEGVENMRGNSLLATAPDQTLIPRPVRAGGKDDDACDFNPEEQEKFRALFAVGRFMALAVYREQPLPLSFSLVACKHLLGFPVGMTDVQQLDPDFYRGRVEAVLKEGGLAKLVEALGEPLTFMSAPTELLPTPSELKPGGADIIVTEDNKREYVKLLCEAYVCGGIRREIQCVLQGFWDLLPLHLLRKCSVTPRELSILISGVQVIDPQEWQRCSRGGEGTQVREWFWDIVENDLDDEQRCMLLHFATGSSRLPPGGIEDLQPIFTISISPGSEERLPVAHTCSNQLVLQEYSSREQLHQKLMIALLAKGFEFV